MDDETPAPVFRVSRQDIENYFATRNFTLWGRAWEITREEDWKREDGPVDWLMGVLGDVQAEKNARMKVGAEVRCRENSPWPGRRGVIAEHWGGHQFPWRVSFDGMAYAPGLLASELDVL